MKVVSSGVSAMAGMIAFARTPSGIAKIVGDRSKRIGAIVPDIGITIAITIARDPQIDRWQELRIAKGTRPAAHHPPAGHSPIDHFHEGDQFAFEQIPTAAFIGQAG